MDKLNEKVSLSVYSQEDLVNAGCFNIKKSIEVCEQAFVDYAEGKVILPDKISVVFDQQTQDRINCLPAAVLNKKVYGMKWVSVFPDNPEKRNQSNLTAVILLSDIKTGYPIAFMEGSMVTNLRTAAVGAIAAKYLAKKNCISIGFIGAGEIAKTHLLAMKEVHPEIAVCWVASRTTKSENKFIRQMKRFYPDIQYIACNSDYEMAVRDADIIVTAISGQEKILQADWIKEGAFYCHVAGVEDDFAVAQKASKIVCDNWETVKHRTQTISQMYRLGLLKDTDIYADLDEIITLKKPGRKSEAEFVYFNSVGLSFLDVSLANWMYSKCVPINCGKDLQLKQNSVFEILDV